MQRSAARGRVLVAMFIAVLSPAACDTAPVAPPATPQLTIAGGDAQIAATSSSLPQLLAVRLTDARNRPMPMVPILWIVEEGGGSIRPWTRSSVTSATGLALASHTFGPEQGSERVSATAIDVAGAPSVTFTLRAVAALVQVHDRDEYACWYYGHCSGSFSPAEAVVPVGGEVGWLWAGGGDHNVTFEDDAVQPASSGTQREGTHLRTFPAPGRYRYRCTIHSLDFTSGAIGAVSVQ